MSILSPAKCPPPALQRYIARNYTTGAPPGQHDNRIPTGKTGSVSPNLLVRRGYLPGGGQFEGAQGFHHHELDSAPPICSSWINHVRHNGQLSARSKGWLVNIFRPKFTSLAILNALNPTCSGEARTTPPSKSRKCLV